MSTLITLDTPIKFLREDGGATHASKASYPINRWMRVRGELIPCQNGYHYTTPRHWRMWMTTRIHLVEAEEPLFYEDKFCARGIKLQPRLATWTPRAAVLFAADCAKRVLPIFEGKFPDDPRPRQAIEAARSGSAAWAAGAAADAARAAAEAAAVVAAVAVAATATATAEGAAARAADAARAAAWAADAADAEVWAPWAADAARAAVAAVEAAETKWQDARFLQYLNGEVR